MRFKITDKAGVRACGGLVGFCCGRFMGVWWTGDGLLRQVYGRVVDWWAVGVLAWEFVTGENPFYHKNPEQARTLC